MFVYTTDDQSDYLEGPTPETYEPVLRPIIEPRPVRKRSSAVSSDGEHLSGVAHHGRDLLVAQPASEGRHAASPVQDQRFLTGGFGESVEDPPLRELGASASPAGSAVAARTLPDPHRAPFEQRRIRANGDFRRNPTTGCKCCGGNGGNDEAHQPHHTTGQQTTNLEHPRDRSHGAIEPRHPILMVVGFDPRRQHKRTPFDYFFVAASFVAVLVLIAWAFLG